MSSLCNRTTWNSSHGREGCWCVKSSLPLCGIFQNESEQGSRAPAKARLAPSNVLPGGGGETGDERPGSAWPPCNTLAPRAMTVPYLQKTIKLVHRDASHPGVKTVRLVNDTVQSAGSCLHSTAANLPESYQNFVSWLLDFLCFHSTESWLWIFAFSQTLNRFSQS